MGRSRQGEYRERELLTSWCIICGRAGVQRVIPLFLSVTVSPVDVLPPPLCIPSKTLAVPLSYCQSTHLTRSNARTVPSRLAETSAWPLGRNCTAVMGAVWSVKVTKQKPDDCWNTLTCGGWQVWGEVWGRCEKVAGMGGVVGEGDEAEAGRLLEHLDLWRVAGVGKCVGKV